MDDDLERCLILGAGGMLGQKIGFGDPKLRSELDLLDTSKIEDYVAIKGVNSILCLAGMNLRSVESDPNLALEVNALAIERLAKLALKKNILLTFISSGAVFCGEYGQIFNENSNPLPLNLYGKLKFLSELLIRYSGCQYQIIRTGWVFGGHASGHRKFVDVVAEKLVRGEVVEGNIGQTGSPTFVDDLVLEIRKLLISRETGIFHVVNDGLANGYELASEVAAFFNQDNCVIKQNSVQDDSILRSHSEALSSNSIQLRHWKKALNEYLESTYG